MKRKNIVKMDKKQINKMDNQLKPDMDLTSNQYNEKRNISGKTENGDFIIAWKTIIRKKFIPATALIIAFSTGLLSSCQSNTTGVSKVDSSSISSTPVSGTTTQNATEVKVVGTLNFETEDYDFDWKNTAHTTIVLNHTTATVSGDGAKVAGAIATIYASGIYEITGSLDNGGIVVDVDKTIDKKTVFLIFNNVDITSQTSAPVNISNAKKTVILLADGTQNKLYGGPGCLVDASQEPSAALFSKSDLTIAGNGNLTVTSDYNDGITSKDVLKITGGTIVIKAKADGISGKDAVGIENANITIDAEKDGIRSTNEVDTNAGNILIRSGKFQITATNDSIQAVDTLEIQDGFFQLSSGGGYPGKSINTNTNGGGQGGPGTQTTTTNTTSESKKGLKAGKQIVVSGGNLTISSYQDTLNSNGNITINAGTLTLQSGDDGVHAEGNVWINDGIITIKNAYEGIEGTNITVQNGSINLLTSDDGFNINKSNGLFTISGGNIMVNANGDGLDSNGSIIVTGGVIYVDGPIANDNGALDYDSSFSIRGGTLVASGSSGMAEAPGADSSQYSIMMYYTSAQTAGTQITLKDKNGNTVASYTPIKKYSSVAISSPLLTSGSTYTLYSGTTKITDVKISEKVTYLSETGVISKPLNTGPGGRR